MTNRDLKEVTAVYYAALAYVAARTSNEPDVSLDEAWTNLLDACGVDE